MALYVSVDSVHYSAGPGLESELFLRSLFFSVFLGKENIVVTYQDGNRPFSFHVILLSNLFLVNHLIIRSNCFRNVGSVVK